MLKFSKHMIPGKRFLCAYLCTWLVRPPRLASSLLLLILSWLSVTANAISLESITTKYSAQLQLADKQLAQALEQLALRYPQQQFNLEPTAICYDTQSCQMLSGSGVTSYTDANTTAQADSVIGAIITGFVPSTIQTGLTCSPGSNGQAEIDSSGFTKCLVSGYANHLAIEVRFKTYAAAPTLSPALADKKVLFLAQSIGYNPSYIIHSLADDGTNTAVPQYGSIGSFTCINPAGTATGNDGLNNGAALGTILLQGEQRNLDTHIQPTSTLGSFRQCITV